MLENFPVTWILAFIVIALTFIKWYFSRNDDYWKKRGVPYIPRMNYLTMVYKLSTKNFADSLKELHKKHGRIVGTFEGSLPTVTVTDPNILRDILVKDFQIFPYRREVITGDPIADCSVTTLTGEDWKRVRTIITPAFTSKRMRKMGSIINDCSKTVLQVCEKHWSKGEPVDCKGLFGAFTMDVIARSAFGTVVDSHNDPNNDFVKRVKESFLKFTIARFFLFLVIPNWLLRWIPFFQSPFKMDKEDFFRNVTMNVIKQRREKGIRYNDFLQILMDAADENAKQENLEVEDETDRFGSITNSEMSPNAKYKRLTENEVLSQCILFFTVGYETTATVLSFVAYCLAVNPEWQEKLIVEVDTAFSKHKEMSYDAVREMKILDAVVSETMRMHPPILGGERTCLEDYQLGNTGITIEKGMRVIFYVFLMHYDPEFFQDPDTFNPERFMDSFEPKHPQYAYLPFGAGPRNCLGMRFALLEIKVCLTNVLRHFRFKRHSSTKVPLEYTKGMLFNTVSELPLILEKRRDVK